MTSMQTHQNWLKELCSCFVSWFLNGRNICLLLSFFSKTLTISLAKQINAELAGAVALHWFCKQTIQAFWVNSVLESWVLVMIPCLFVLDMQTITTTHDHFLTQHCQVVNCNHSVLKNCHLRSHHLCMCCFDCVMFTCIINKCPWFHKIWLKNVSTKLFTRIGQQGWRGKLLSLCCSQQHLANTLL